MTDETHAHEQEPQAASPPDSSMLDAQIAELVGKYPEYSALDIEQAEIDADARRNWDSGAYPPYVGPGYTEPPVNWEGWHRPRSDYEKDHYWDHRARDRSGLGIHSADIPVRDEHFALPDLEAGQ